jgi:hypothetical protein
MLRDARSVAPLIREELDPIRAPQPSQGPDRRTRVSHKYAERAPALRRVVGNPEALEIQREWV